MFKIAILVFAGNCLGQVSGDAVDNAIEHVDWHYSDKLCLDLLLVDCSKHVTQHDEEICASNGVTYPDHCRYVHAYCEFAYSNPKLSVASHGPCPVATVPPTTAQPIVTTAAISGSSDPSVVMTTALPAGSTAAPVVTTVAPVVTTTTAAPTTNPNHNIIQDVFCQNAAGISCASSGVDVICASNGVLYPNQCEFAKAHCVIPNLTHADASFCASMGK